MTHQIGLISINILSDNIKDYKNTIIQSAKNILIDEGDILINRIAFNSMIY